MAANSVGRQVTITLQSPHNERLIMDRKFVLNDNHSIMMVGRSSSKDGYPHLKPAVENAYFKCAVVSRDHAQIFILPNSQSVFLDDVGSMHGTSVDGKAIRSGEPVSLKPKSMIALGDRNFVGNRKELFVSFEINWKWEEIHKPIDSTHLNSQSSSQPTNTGEDHRPKPASGKSVAISVAGDSSAQKKDPTLQKPPQTFRVPESESEASELGEPYTDDIDDDDLLFVKAVSRNSDQLAKDNPSNSRPIEKEGGLPGSSPSNPVNIEEPSASARFSKDSFSDVRLRSSALPTPKILGLHLDAPSRMGIQCQKLTLSAHTPSPPVSIASDSAPSTPWSFNAEDQSNSTLKVLVQQEPSNNTDASVGRRDEHADSKLPKSSASQVGGVHEKLTSQAGTGALSTVDEFTGGPLSDSMSEDDCSVACSDVSDSADESEISEMGSGFPELSEFDESDQDYVSNGPWDDYDGISILSDRDSLVDTKDSTSRRKAAERDCDNVAKKHDQLSQPCLHAKANTKVNVEKAENPLKPPASQGSTNVNEYPALSTGKAVSGDRPKAGEEVNKPTNASLAFGNLLHTEADSCPDLKNANQRAFNSTNLNPRGTSHMGGASLPRYCETDLLRDNGAASTTAYQPWASRPRHYLSDSRERYTAYTPSTANRGGPFPQRVARESYRNFNDGLWNPTDFLGQDVDNDGLSSLVAYADPYSYSMANGVSDVPQSMSTDALWWSAQYPGSYSSIDPYHNWHLRDDQGASVNNFSQSVGEDISQVSADSVCPKGKENATSDAQTLSTAAVSAWAPPEPLPLFKNANNSMKNGSGLAKKRKADSMAGVIPVNNGDVSASAAEKKKDTRVPVSHLLREHSSIPSPPCSEDSTANAGKSTPPAMPVESPPPAASEEVVPVADPATSPDPICAATTLIPNGALTRATEVSESNNLDPEERGSIPSSSPIFTREHHGHGETGEGNPRPSKRTRLSVSKSSALPFFVGTVVGGIGMIGALISLPDSFF